MLADFHAMKRAAIVALLLVSVALAQSFDDPTKAQIDGAVSSTANGQLLARARIFLRHSAQKDSYVTWVDADDYGHFLFKSVEEGTYEILAEKSGFYADPHKTPSQTLDVKAGDRIHGIVLRLIPFAAVSGRIVNEHDDPVQDTQVRLLSKEYLHGRELLNPAGFATTDDRGEYRIFAVKPGNYYLVVEYDAKKSRANPFPGIRLKDTPPEVSYPPLFYPLTSDLRQAQRITVTPGAELRFDFAFLSAPSVSIEGKVVNGITGEPAKNPSVTAFWGDRITGITRKVDLTGTGEFKLDGIEPGPYTLVATMTVDNENYSDFQIAPDVDRLTPEEIRSVHSDRQGRFTLRGITPGAYKLYAWEEIDVNELMSQLDLLKNFDGESQLVRVDENGYYNPELRAIEVR